MKLIRGILTLMMFGTAATAGAAPIVHFTPFTAAGGLSGVTLSVNPNDWTNGYDTIEVKLRSVGDVPNSFNQTGPSVKAGTDMGVSADTAFNGFLITPTFLGGLGATIQPGGQGFENDYKLEGAIATLGNNSLSAADYKVADVVLTAAGVPSGFSYVLQFANDGLLLGAVEGTYPVPEPTVATGMLLMGALVVVRSRSRVR